MPRKYMRKEGVRARVISWTSDHLQLAFDEIDKKKLGINVISKRFGIPARTLRRRYATKNKTKLTLGKHPVLGFENEKKLVAIILKLVDAGVPLNRRFVCNLAYQFAENLDIQHNFDNENQIAGNEWFQNFIERNPELSVRQEENVPIARTKVHSTEEVNELYIDYINKLNNNFYELLTDSDPIDKTKTINNTDESDIQLNNKPGKVAVKKSIKGNMSA